jgi:hypothetical protein
MSEVKRYDVNGMMAGFMKESDDGRYVLASDYDNAMAERDELVALVSKLEQDHECEDPEHCRC